MTTYLHTGASIANYKAVQIVPGPNADETALIVIALGPYQLSFVGWDAEAIAAEWNISSNPFFQQITASINGTTLVLTSNILGQDFEVTVSINGDIGSRVSAIQVLTVFATGGTFTLSDGSVTSGAITYSATPATLRTNIQTAINAMSGYSSGDVVVTGSGPFLLEFDSGRFTGLAVARWTAVSSLTGGSALATVTTSQDGNTGTNEIITISFPADGTHIESLDEIQEINVTSAVAGEFILTVPTYGSTNPIPFTAGRSRIKTELENLVGLDNTIVTGGPLSVLADPILSSLNGTLTNDGQVGQNGLMRFESNNHAGVSLYYEVPTPTNNLAGLFRFTLDAARGTTVDTATLSFTIAGFNGQLTQPAKVWCVGYTTNNPAWPANYAAAAAYLNSATPLPENHASNVIVGGLGDRISFDVTDTIQDRINQFNWTSGDAIILYLQLPELTSGSCSLVVESIESDADNKASLQCVIVDNPTETAYTRYPVTVQFVNEVGGINVGAMSADTIATISTVQNGGTQTVENIVGGVWSLLITNPATDTSYNIPNIPYDVTAAELDTLIEAVCGAGTVTVTGGPAPSTPLVIQFTGALEKTALTEIIVSSLEGNFGTSSSLATIREAIPPPEVDNCWDMTVIPGEGTLAVNDEKPSVSRGYLILTISEPEAINPASIIDNNIYIPLLNIHPARIETAINEAYGKDVVRVTRIVHSLEHAEIPAHTNYSSVATVSTPLHFWYYRDVFRLVFVNDFQAADSITNVSVRIASVHEGNLAAASPALWMTTTSLPPTDGDVLDLYHEAHRVYLGFTNYLVNEQSEQYHEFSCVRNTNTISNKLSYRVKLLTQFAGDAAASEAKRAGIARQITDNTIVFSWVKQIPTNPSQYPPTYSPICSTPPLNWDASPDVIEAALSTLVTGFMDSVSVTGTLYNSWRSEYDIDAHLPEESYNDLRITLTGNLAHLPLTELGYTLIATISPAYASPDLRNPLVWIEPYSVPLPGGLNQRQRFSLASASDVSSLSLVIDDYTINGLTPATTADQLQDLISAEIGYLAIGGTAVSGWGTPIPEKWRNPVTVYGTTLAQPVEIEFSGFGFQYASHSAVLGVVGATSVIAFVETQAGVNPVGEIQNLVISGSPHNGTYTIDGGAALAYNANAAAIQANLGAAPPTVTGTYPAFVLTWPSASGNVAQLATTSNLNNSFVTVSDNDDGSQTGGLGASATVSDLIPGTGPLYLDNPQNYSPAAVFGSDDTLVIDDTVSAINFGLDMSSYFTVIDLGVAEPTGVGTIFQHARNRIVFQDDQKVYLTGTGTAPAGLTFGNAYYIVNSTNSYTFGLSATPSGAAIVVTTVGTGTFRLTLRNVTLTVYSRYTGNNIGLPNNNSATSLPEYLAKYLVLPGVNADIGLGDGNGLNLFRLDSDDQPATILIQQSGQSSTANVPAILLLCNNEDTNITILDGEVGIAVYSQEESLLHDLIVSGGGITIHNTTIEGTLTTSNGVTPVIQSGCTIAGLVTIE